MLGKWVGSATIGNRLVGMGISGTANVGAQIYYGEEFSWATFGTSIITGGATVNMGYWGATTVNAAGRSVVGSSAGYLIGKGEMPFNKWLNPEKNNMKWQYSPNTPIIYPYPKNNIPSIIAGSLSAAASEFSSKNSEILIESTKVRK